MSDRLRGVGLYDVLSPDEAAAWLDLSRRQLDRLDLPVVYLGNHSPRYVVRDVLDELGRRTLRPADPRRN